MKPQLAAHTRRHVLHLWVVASLLQWAAGSFAQATDEALRIGTYDSRAVAIAYAGSRLRQQKMDDLKARHEQAVQAGDRQAAARLEAEGKAWQAVLHRQGLGAASGDDLLVHIGAHLPRIQQAAGVTRLVSKWNLLDLARHPRAERVDVTMALVDAFEPSARARQFAIDIQGKAPSAAP